MIDDRGLTEQALLKYYERKQCSGQWSGFVGLFFDELLRSAGERDAHAFLRHIGTRLGRSLELGQHETLGGLEAAMNRQWDQLDWGFVNLAERDLRLVIRHSAYPVPASLVGEDTARGAMAAVLEGIYATWLEKQSGESGIPLRLAGSRSGNVLEFHYGRH